MRRLAGILLLGAGIAAGCTLAYHAGREIPPPGGCDRCHRVPIAADWQATLGSAEVPRPERRYPWQRPESGLPAATPPGEQSLEEACFNCHRSPDLAHADYHGRYHRHP